jgi:two-component system sensor histidine kinase VicK
MNFARLKPLELQTINLREILLDLPEKFQHQLQQKEIEFKMDLPEKLPALELDPELFTIMISNIITNSLEELPKGGKITLNVNKNRDLLEIIIADNGSGIESVDLAMRSFFTGKTGRAGLGFNFVRYIAGIHDFAFKLESEINKGTKARIILMGS